MGLKVWNEEALYVLKCSWERGHTGGDISNELGVLGYCFTRNAVIGKANRMGIKQPPRGEHSPKAPKSQPRKRIVVPATDPRAKTWTKKKSKLPTFIQTNALDPHNPGVSLMELKFGGCKAVIGRSHVSKLATYCNEDCDMGKSFCPGHALLYYRAPEPRKHRY
jgi:hypothetical protein